MHAMVNDVVGYESRSAPSEGAPRVSPWLALGLLEELEQLPARATGALVIGDPSRPSGTILVENGRVCWANAVVMPRRLTDMLLRQADPPVERTTFEAAYRRCLKESRPFGETLVSLGLVTGTGLRNALRQHTSEAIGLLGLDHVSSRSWIDHRRLRYDAQYTYSLAEILAGIGATSRSKLARRAQAELVAALASGGVGAAFVRDGASAGPVPLAVHDADGLLLREVMALGEQAASTLDLCGAFTENAKLAVRTLPIGGGLACWRAEGVEYSAVCPDSSTVAFVVTHRARHRHQGE